MRAYNGGFGAEPQWGPGAEPLVRGLGEKSPKAESLYGFERLTEVANLPHFLFCKLSKPQLLVTISQTLKVTKYIVCDQCDPWWSLGPLWGGGISKIAITQPRIARLR